MRGYPRVGAEEDERKESARQGSLLPIPPAEGALLPPALPFLLLPTLPSARRWPQFPHLRGGGRGAGPAIFYAHLARGWLPTLAIKIRMLFTFTFQMNNK